PIAVLVLDQKMPRMSGTQLAVRLRSVRPGLRVIMFSGEAGPEDVGEAMNLDFNEYLDKERVQELPGRVAYQYLMHLVDNANSTSQVPEIVWPLGRLSRWLRRIQIRRVAVVELDRRVVEPSGWVTVLQLNAGEERKLRYEISHSVSQTMEIES